MTSAISFLPAIYMLSIVFEISLIHPSTSVHPHSSSYSSLNKYKEGEIREAFEKRSKVKVMNACLLITDQTLYLVLNNCSYRNLLKYIFFWIITINYFFYAACYKKTLIDFYFMFLMDVLI